MLNFLNPDKSQGFFCNNQLLLPYHNLNTTDMIVATITRFWKGCKYDGYKKWYTASSFMVYEPCGSHGFKDFSTALTSLIEEEVDLSRTARSITMKHKDDEASAGWWSPVTEKGLVITVSDGIRRFPLHEFYGLLKFNGYAKLEK